MTERFKGKVKWFHAIKGYGFIETKDGDLFFHISEFEEKNVKVEIGNELEYETENTDKGKKATKIKKIQKEK